MVLSGLTLSDRVVLSGHQYVFTAVTNMLCVWMSVLKQRTKSSCSFFTGLQSPSFMASSFGSRYPVFIT